MAIAFSSAEAEYYAMVKGPTRGIGVKTMLKEIGMKAEITLSTDCSAAKSLGSRRGNYRSEQTLGDEVAVAPDRGG